MDFEKIKQQENNFYMPTFNRYNLCFTHGKGTKLYDTHGKEYTDFCSGIAVNVLGHGDDDLVGAICDQAKKLIHVSNLYYNEPQSELAERLIEGTNFSRVFLSNSGAEANECAIKLARKYSFDKYGKGRHNIITLANSFHGRTLCTLSATGQDVFHNYFFPFVEGFINAEANNIDDLKAKLDDTVCAVMIEYIQGEGGVVPLQQDFVDAVFSLCGEKDVLVIADEVQTGVGRTGKFLAGDNFGHKANISTLAKGIAGGLPMGVCLADDKCKDVLGRGTHGSTFGGNPVCCAGGLAVLDFIESGDHLQQVGEKGKYLKEKLLKIEEISRADGMGLMLGAALKTKKAADVVAEALEKGLLMLTAKDKLRFLPPLTITYEEIDKGVKILEDILK